MSFVATIREQFDVVRLCREELRNWPGVLLRVGLSKAGWNRGVFTASSRGGVVLQAPNHPLGRLPLIEILAEDTYGLRKIQWQNPLADRVVLDIGAQVGSFSCALGAQLPGARFFCVEPLPGTVEWLSTNLARNGLANRSAIFNAAVAGADGQAELWASKDASGEASLDHELWASWQTNRKEAAMLESVRRITVRTMSFDTIVAAAGGHVDIVKLDCEGGEYPAILQASSGAWAHVERLFLEYHPVADHDFEDLHGRLSEFGLHLVWQHHTRRAGMGTAYFAREL